MIHRRPFLYVPLIALLLTLAVMAPAAGQSRSRRNQNAPPPSPVPSGQKKSEVLTDFSGILKGISKHELVIEPEPDNQMTFVRSKHTKFLRGGKEIKEDAVKTGAAVTIQSFTKLNGELEAVTLTVNEPADQESSPIK
jgi:hypothetical protein